nr:immunoglobulin light chain junction region [Macaca mulatta]
CSSYADSNVLV